jgi:hypothetical protein
MPDIAAAEMTAKLGANMARDPTARRDATL